MTNIVIAGLRPKDGWRENHIQVSFFVSSDHLPVHNANLDANEAAS